MAREVDLVIKARNEATKAIDSIKDALKELTGVQEDVGKSAQKTDTLLGALGQQLSKLNAEARGLQALEKVGDSVTKAGEGVRQLEGNVEKAHAALSELNSEAAKAKQTTEALKAQVTAQTQALNQQAAATKNAKKAQSDANAELRRAQGILNTLNGRIQQAKKPSDDVLAKAAAQKEIVDRLKAAQQAAAQNFQVETAAQTQSAQSLKILNEQLSAAERQETKLAAAVKSATADLDRQLGSLQKGERTFSEVADTADQAAGAFRRFGLSQADVARSTAETQARLSQIQALIDRQKMLDSAAASPVRSVAAYKSQLEAIAQAKKDLEEARKALTDFGREFQVGRIGPQTREIADNFDLLKVKVAQSEQAFMREVDVMRQLRGVSQQTFAEWSAGLAGQKKATVGQTQAILDYQRRIREAALASRAYNVEAGASGPVIARAAAATGNFRDALGGVFGEGRQALSLIQRLRGEILSLTASYLGFQAAIQGIGSVIDAFRTLEAVQNRLGAVFHQNQQMVGQEIQFLRAQADRLGITFSTLADEYAKFAVASDAANFSSGATRKIFLAVAEAGRVNKLSIDQLQGVFLALQQMISKGKVSSEELTRQLGDRLPGAVNIFAQALGISVAELTDLMKKGEVLSNQSNMLKFADELNKRFGPQLQTALESTTTQIGRFQNSLFNAALAVANGGFIQAFTDMLRHLNEAFRSKEGNDFFLSLGAALGRVTRALTYLIDNFGALKLIFQFFISYKITDIFFSLVAALRQTTVEADATAGAMGRTRTQMVASIGSFGILRNALRDLVLSYRLTAVEMQATANTSRVTIGLMTGVRLGVSALTAIVRIAAVAFRGLWIAMGGLPGLILTGVTIAIGAWLSRVDDTTAAVEEHKRIMDGVIEAYQNVRDTTKQWRDAVKDVTLSQAIASAQKLDEAYQKAISKAISFNRVLVAGFSDFDPSSQVRREISTMEAVLQGLQHGTVSIENVIKTLDSLGQTGARQEIRDTAVALLDMINKAKDGNPSIQQLGQSLREARAIIQVMRGNVDDATKSTLGVKEATDDAADATNKYSEKLKQFNDLMDAAGKLIPQMSAELKRFGELDALNKQYQQAAKLVTTWSQLLALNKQFQAATDAINLNALQGVTGDFASKLISIESGGVTNAKNPNSTATGLGQFITSTWLRMFKQYFPDRAASMSDAMILELRKDADTSKAMIELYAKENSKVLQDAGVQLNDASLYLAHFLGPQGAAKILNASAGTPVSELLAPQAIDKNKSVLEGKTAGQVVEWAMQKMNIDKQDLVIRQKINSEADKEIQKGKDYRTDLENRLKYGEDELDNAGKLTREMYIQKAIDEETKKARAAQQTLSEQDLARIKAIAGAEYDRKQATKETTASLKEANAALAAANALYAQRQTLTGSLKAAQAVGDNSKITSLQAQLDDVNQKFQEASDKARQMFEVIGGDVGTAAIAKLDQMKLKIDSANKSFSYFGLNASQIQTLVGSFADGLVGVFDSFAEAIANGQNAFKALGRAFLQFAANFLKQIAEMILKQMILNALAGFGGPIGSAAKALSSGAAHSGGVVGGMLTGSGNAVKTVPAMAFAGAPRYHGGGIAGLAPDEVPTVLKRGEEVLKRTDSRHRGNAGLMGGGKQDINLRNIVTLDPEFARSMITNNEATIMSLVRKNKATLRQLVRTS